MYNEPHKRIFLYILQTCIFVFTSSKIVFDINLIYKNNDIVTCYPKSNRRDKYTKLISGIWKRENKLKEMV